MPKSLTGRYLKGELKIPTPIFRRRNNGPALEMVNARKHNLKNLNVRIPLGIFVCITGVSGSGKSTLVHDVLYAAIQRAKGRATRSAGRVRCPAGRRPDCRMPCSSIRSPIGKTPRSNPVTYIKAFDAIRQIFAATRDAYARNLRPSHFSFNLSGGRCETCQGSGTITVEMQFLADVELTCEDCKGTRYKSSVLEVQYKGKNIAEVLDLTVHEAIDFFAGHAKLVRKAPGAGGYRTGISAPRPIGKFAVRRRGAEDQAGRVHLRARSRNILYIFDEPTTGLHFDDIRKLIDRLRQADPGRQLGGGHRTQSGCHQERRLGDRSGPGRGARGRPDPV